jgi:hypothetical protein
VLAGQGRGGFISAGDVRIQCIVPAINVCR